MGDGLSSKWRRDRPTFGWAHAHTIINTLYSSFSGAFLGCWTPPPPPSWPNSSVRPSVRRPHRKERGGAPHSFWLEAFFYIRGCPFQQCLVLPLLLRLLHSVCKCTQMPHSQSANRKGSTPHPTQIQNIFFRFISFDYTTTQIDWIQCQMIFFFPQGGLLVIEINHYSNV
jgi:hypothetical protein